MPSIDPTQARAPLKPTRLEHTAPVKDNAPKEPRSAAEAPRHRLQDSIQQWFSQAGIRNRHSAGYQTEEGKRLLRRQRIVEQRKLHNLEHIMQLAMDYCPDSGNQEHLDPDWFFSFVEMAENIHSKLMQELWGKIFAVEIAKPGSFSLRTLQVLRQLTQRDAQLFKKAGSLASRRRSSYSPKILVGYVQRPSLLGFLSLRKNHQLNLAEFGLGYPEILSLIDMGLLYNSEIESGELAPNQAVEWCCGQQWFRLTPRKNGLALHYHKFTSTGAELMRLLAADTHQDYLAALKTTLGCGFDVKDAGQK